MIIALLIGEDWHKYEGDINNLPSLNESMKLPLMSDEEVDKADYLVEYQEDGTKLIWRNENDSK